jgi:hypothetical protein
VREVSVRVAEFHTSAAKVPNDVNVLPEYAQTLAGSEVIILPIDVEALLIAVLVFPLMTAAKLDDAVPILLSVFALIVAVSPVTSDCVARLPVSKFAPVSVRVLLFHTSAASVPNVDRLLLPYAHTVAGSDAIIEPIDVEALLIALFVFALITLASDDDAVPILLSVLALTVVAILPVCVFVFELTCEVIELDALCMSDNVAREPEDKPAPVNVRVPLFHTSATSVPNVVILRDPYAHIVAGREVIIDPIELDAVFVFAFTNVTIELEAFATVLFVFALTADVMPLVFETIEVLRDVDAVCISDNVASDPVVSPLPVSVRAE